MSFTFMQNNNNHSTFINSNSFTFDLSWDLIVEKCRCDMSSRQNTCLLSLKKHAY